LSWQENLHSDEIPPEWMWAIDHELEEWFEEVKRAREERYGSPSEDESRPMMQNELTKGRR
jgi:hypothetical protein